MAARKRCHRVRIKGHLRTVCKGRRRSKAKKCRFGVNKITGRCLKNKRARRR